MTFWWCQHGFGKSDINVDNVDQFPNLNSKLLQTRLLNTTLIRVVKCSNLQILSSVGSFHVHTFPWHVRRTARTVFVSPTFTESNYNFNVVITTRLARSQLSLTLKRKQIIGGRGRSGGSPHSSKLAYIGYPVTQLHQNFIKILPVPPLFCHVGSVSDHCAASMETLTVKTSMLLWYLSLPGRISAFPLRSFMSATIQATEMDRHPVAKQRKTVRKLFQLQMIG